MSNSFFFNLARLNIKPINMKNNFLSIILSLFLVSTLNAQNWNFGIKAGGNLSNITNVDEFKTKFGINFGAVATVEISDVFSIQPELFYSAQGYNDETLQQDAVARIDYFHVPLLASYEVTDGVSLQAGPQLGFNIRAEVERDGQEPFDLSIVNDVDFSGVVGAQVQVDENFFIQGRYVFGLNEAFRNSSDQKNSVISLSLGFMFDKADGESVEEDEE